MLAAGVGVAVRLNHAQLLALVDGMDWKKVRSASVRRPQSLG